MPRYKITIEYDGSPFLGWQSQKDGCTVQGELTKAIKAFSGEDVTVLGAGRTDRGVHAIGQVAHIDFAKEWPPETIRDAVNAHLRPQPISILEARLMEDDFDARFSAKSRHYLYRILIRRALPALTLKRAWHVPHRLNGEAMTEAAQSIIGHHDFTTFRSIHCQSKSPLKTLDELTLEKTEEGFEIRASARSFLHHQVRSMVGSLKCVGEGKWPVQQMAAALEAKDRAACGPVAPAHGLYFVGAKY